ncbi:sterol desaturase family protein [Streptomyces sp. NPDC045431]|uniref:sterol desaturase family protein n=1 Tax=Streptomyces sp. NPDC045431 TaxID=3155613 RepID=UPI003407DE99
MHNLPDIVLWSTPAFALFSVAELLSYRLRPSAEAMGYGFRDTLTSVTLGLVSLATDALWKIPVVALYAAAYSVTPLRAPLTWWAWPLALIAQDFLYYWSHRAHHRVRVLWACHVVHHSSRKFNLTSALRQPWTNAAVWLFYLPLVLLGVHPAAVLFCASANLVYQFFLHTERVGKLPPFVEAVFNTPSHHRVHHASQRAYLDCNYAGILITWDRLFGSFVAEEERPVYGLTKNVRTYNPLRVAFHGYVELARDVRAEDTWRGRLAQAFRPPGRPVRAVTEARCRARTSPATPPGPGNARCPSEPVP